MKEIFENTVVNGVPTKKKYVSPEIEIIELSEPPRLLDGSPNGSYSTHIQDINEETI